MTEFDLEQGVGPRKIKYASCRCGNADTIPAEVRRASELWSADPESGDICVPQAKFSTSYPSAHTHRLLASTWTFNIWQINLLYTRQIISLARSEEHTSELQSLAYLVCR